MSITSKLTVYFDDPFWAAVYERAEDGRLQVSKVVFGAEPKDCEIYDFFLTNWNRLNFSGAVAATDKTAKKLNPKRMQRAITSQLMQRGIGTKAQQALKLQQEKEAVNRKVINRQKTEEDKQLRFESKQQKKKQKHKGR